MTFRNQYWKFGKFLPNYLFAERSDLASQSNVSKANTRKLLFKRVRKTFEIWMIKFRMQITSSIHLFS